MIARVTVFGVGYHITQRLATACTCSPLMPTAPPETCAKGATEDRLSRGIKVCAPGINPGINPPELTLSSLENSPVATKRRGTRRCRTSLTPAITGGLGVETPTSEVILMANTTADHRPKLLALVAEQLDRKGSMAFVRETYQRLRGAGFSDREIRGMLMQVLATEYYRVVAHAQPFDRARYEQGVRRLPALPWHVDHSGYPCDVTEQEVAERILDNPNFSLDTVAELRARYRRLRPQLNALQNAVLQYVPGDAILASGKALGLLHQGVLVFDSEQDAAVLADHALYADPRLRRRHLEAWLSARTRGISDEQAVVLAAMAEARYAVVTCEYTIPEAGVEAMDLLRGHSFPLMDLMLSRSAYPGALLATHLVTIDSVHLSTGALLQVVDVKTVDALKAALPSGRKTFDEQNSDGRCTTRIIRALLGARSPVANVPLADPVSRNAPCPCGSGKKYKRCCGARA